MNAKYLKVDDFDGHKKYSGRFRVRTVVYWPPGSERNIYGSTTLEVKQSNDLAALVQKMVESGTETVNCSAPGPARVLAKKFGTGYLLLIPCPYELLDNVLTDLDCIVAVW